MMWGEPFRQAGGPKKSRGEALDGRMGSQSMNLISVSLNGMS